jgi:hypothetical protein
MKPVFYIDCPDPHAAGDDVTGYVSVTTKDTYEAALRYVRDHWGSLAADHHADLFITEGQL